MVVPPDQVEAVDSFDVVVPAVYAGHWLKPARELVDRSGDALAARPVWLFSSSPIGDPPSPRRTRWTSPRSCRPPRPASIGVFAGKLVRKQLNFPDRAIAAALRVPEGDFGTGRRPGGDR